MDQKKELILDKKSQKIAKKIMMKKAKNENKEIKIRIKEIKKEFLRDLKNAQTRQERKEIRQGRYARYDEIYEKYGTDAYNRNVSSQYREKDLKKLMKEKRYIDIYNKHGEYKVNKNLAEMIANDIKFETGNDVKAVFSKMKYKLIKNVFPAILGGTLGLTGGAIGLVEEERVGSTIREYNEIQLYKEDIKNHAEIIKSYNLTDLQNIMIVMHDMWDGIEGYGSAEHENYAYLGLSLWDERSGRVSKYVRICCKRIK